MGGSRALGPSRQPRGPLPLFPRPRCHGCGSSVLLHLAHVEVACPAGCVSCSLGRSVAMSGGRWLLLVIPGAPMPSGRCRHLSWCMRRVPEPESGLTSRLANPGPCIRHPVQAPPVRPVLVADCERVTLPAGHPRPEILGLGPQFSLLSFPCVCLTGRSLLSEGELDLCNL